MRNLSFPSSSPVFSASLALGEPGRILYLRNDLTYFHLVNLYNFYYYRCLNYNCFVYPGVCVHACMYVFDVLLYCLYISFILRVHLFYGLTLHVNLPQGTIKNCHCHCHHRHPSRGLLLGKRSMKPLKSVALRYSLEYFVEILVPSGFLCENRSIGRQLHAGKICLDDVMLPL